MSEFGLGRVAPLVAIGALAVTAVVIQLSPTPSDASETDVALMEAVPSAESEQQSDSERTIAAASPDQTAVVTRGNISETITLSGRIGSAEEALLAFRSPQRIAGILVNVGDVVDEGQPLAKADERELARSLVGARERLSAAQSKLAQAEELAASQQHSVERRQELTRLRGERAISSAEAALRRAEADVERIQAGASPAERRAAETSIANARAGLARAQADLTRLQQGPDPMEVRQAEQQVVQAQQALNRAVEEVRRLEQGADPVAVRAAERDLLAAQSAVTRAQLDLTKLMQPDQATLAVAERDVQRAETALRIAQMPVSKGSSTEKRDRNEERRAEAQRQSEIQNAKLTLQTAQERLRIIQAGPPPGELSIAQRSLVAARSAFQAAQERLEVVKQGPDQSTVSQAKIAVDAARLAFESAAARLETLRAGPNPDQVSAATSAYQSALLAVRAAEAQQAELLARPSRTDLMNAQETVKAARDGLEQARIEAETTELEAPTGQDSSDLTLLRQTVEQEQAAVQALEEDLAGAQLVAPVAGVVIGVLARVGDGADAGQPVVVLAPRDATPVALADVPTAVASRLAVGQRATVQYSGLTGSPIETTIERLQAPQNGVVRVEFRTDWKQNQPPLGGPASFQVVAQERQDVILVPERALRGVGAQRTVEVIDGAERRVVPVDIGIVADGQAEVRSGVVPGTSVRLTP